MRRARSSLGPLAALALVLGIPGAMADGGPAPPTHRISGFVEAGAGHSMVDASQPSWNDQYVRSSLQITRDGRVGLEVSHQDHFGSGGTFFGATYTHVFDPSWYGALSAGTSANGIFLPRLRVDASMSRKWLEEKRLVTTLGLSYIRSRDVYYDLALLAGVIYYFDAPWILEIGSRVNDSNPGHVSSARAFAAVTYGRDKRFFLTVRGETGHEAYQVVALNDVLSDFSSSEESLIWRQWIGGSMGFNLRIAHYANPSYARWGFEFGVFHEL